MKDFYQIAILMFATLIIAIFFNCSSTFVVIVIFDNAYSVLNITLIMNVFKVENTVNTIVTVNINITISISILKISSIMNNSETESTVITNDLNNYMTVAIINAYDYFLFLFLLRMLIICFQ